MRRVIPVVLVLVTLLPQGVLAAAWHQCGEGRVLRSTCCCPADKAASKEAPPRPELRRAPCCDELTRVPPAGTARIEPSAASRLGPLHLTVPARASIAGPPSGAGSPAPALRATAPPPPPDPIYLRNASLLL